MKKLLFMVSFSLLSLRAYGAESSADSEGGSKIDFQKSRSSIQNMSTSNPSAASDSPPPVQQRGRTQSLAAQFEVKPAVDATSPRLAPASSSPALTRGRTLSVAASFEGKAIMGVISPRTSPDSPLPRRSSIPISPKPLISGHSVERAEKSEIDVTKGDTSSIKMKLAATLELRIPGQPGTPSHKGGRSSAERFSSPPESTEKSLLSPTLRLPQGGLSSPSLPRSTSPDLDEKEERQDVPTKDIAVDHPGMPSWEDLVNLDLPWGLDLEKVIERFNIYSPLKLLFDIHYDVTLDILNLQIIRHRLIERQDLLLLTIPALEEGLIKAKLSKKDTKKKEDAKILIEKLKGDLKAAKSKLEGTHDEAYINLSIEGVVKRVLKILGGFGLTAEYLEHLPAKKPSTNEEKAELSTHTSDEEVSEEENPEALSGAPSPSEAALSLVSPRLSRYHMGQIGESIRQLRKKTQIIHGRQIAREDILNEIKKVLRVRDEEASDFLDQYLSSNPDTFKEIESEASKHA